MCAEDRKNNTDKCCAIICSKKGSFAVDINLCMSLYKIYKDMHAVHERSFQGRHSPAICLPRRHSLL